MPKKLKAREKRVKFQMYHGRKKVDVQDAIALMAHAVAHLMDEQCGNSGYNWLVDFYRDCSLFTKKPKS